MEQDKSCKKLLNEIIKELESVKKQGVEISVELNEQSETLNEITSNLENVSYQSEVSKWQLNYIDSTFGKLYRKLYNYPIKENASNFLKLISLKTKILGMGSRKDIDTRDTKGYESKLDEISNIVNDIKTISTLNSNEIDKQNFIVEYNNELVESSQNKISKNTRKIKKLLN